MKQSTLHHHLPALVARVIAAASRTKPADDVLRATLRTAGGLTDAESREVSRAVFACYRWFGWLDQTLPVGEQVERAQEMAQRFCDTPERFFQRRTAGARGAGVGARGDGYHAGVGRRHPG